MLLTSGREPAAWPWVTGPPSRTVPGFDRAPAPHAAEGHPSREDQATESGPGLNPPAPSGGYIGAPAHQSQPGQSVFESVLDHALSGAADRLARTDYRAHVMGLSRDIWFRALAASGTARWRPVEVRGGGRENRAVLIGPEGGRPCLGWLG